MARIISAFQTWVSSLVASNSSVRAICTLISGTVIAQSVTVFSTPLLTRLYTPDDFGLFAVYFSLISILGALACLKYEAAIPLPEDPLEATHIAILCIAVTIVLSVLTGLILFFFGQPISTLLGTPQLEGILWILPFGIFMAGLIGIFRNCSIRIKKFGAIARTKVSQAITTLLIQLSCFKVGGLALLLSHLGGQTTGAISMALPSAPHFKWRSFKAKGVFASLVRYRNFPLFSTWSGLVNTLGRGLPALFLASSFGPASAGFYALADRMSALPTSLISRSVAEVFYSQIPSAKRENTLAELYTSYQLILIQLGLPFTLILVLTAPQLFTVVFGADWHIAGVYTRWIAVGTFAAFVASPLSMIFPALEKQKTGLLLQLILFVSRLGAIIAGTLSGSALTTIALFSIASFFGYSLYIFVSASSTKAKPGQYWVSLAKTVPYSAAIVTPTAIGLLLPGLVYLCIGLTVTLVLLACFYKRVLAQANPKIPSSSANMT